MPTFVVGTGRCGSTMLSNMLREHPKVLSLSEFFSLCTDAGRTNRHFSLEPIDGEMFWSIIADITPFCHFCLNHKAIPPEWLYPYDSPAARFSRQTGVPGILLTTLPHLTDDHDGLFDLLSDEVPNWPNAPIREHYERLFENLARRFGKHIWVERSGGSIGYVEQLVSTFPDAKFVHMARDGRDAAISMQGHASFKLGVPLFMLGQFLGVDPLVSNDRTHIDRVPAELRPLLPENFDDEAFRAFRFPLQFCGENWSRETGYGLSMLAGLPGDRLLTLRYEDFFADAKGQLDRFATFLGEDYIDEDWSERCAATVRPPRSTWRDLPEDEACALTEACRPGFELLREAGVEYAI
jgi:putative sulfotransferase